MKTLSLLFFFILSLGTSPTLNAEEDEEEFLNQFDEKAKPNIQVEDDTPDNADGSDKKKEAVKRPSAGDIDAARDLLQAPSADEGVVDEEDPTTDSNLKKSDLMVPKKSNVLTEADLEEVNELIRKQRQEIMDFSEGFTDSERKEVLKILEGHLDRKTVGTGIQGKLFDGGFANTVRKVIAPWRDLTQEQAEANIKAFYQDKGLATYLEKHPKILRFLGEAFRDKDAVPLLAEVAEKTDMTAIFFGFWIITIFIGKFFWYIRRHKEGIWGDLMAFMFRFTLLYSLRLSVFFLLFQKQVTPILTIMFKVINS